MKFFKQKLQIFRTNTNKYNPTNKAITVIKYPAFNLKNKSIKLINYAKTSKKQIDILKKII